MTHDDPPDGRSPGERRTREAYRAGERCEDVAEVRGSALHRLLIAAPAPHPGCQARLLATPVAAGASGVPRRA